MCSVPGRALTRRCCKSSKLLGCGRSASASTIRRQRSTTGCAVPLAPTPWLAEPCAWHVSTASTRWRRPWPRGHWWRRNCWLRCIAWPVTAGRTNGASSNRCRAACWLATTPTRCSPPGTLSNFASSISLPIARDSGPRSARSTASRARSCSAAAPAPNTCSLMRRARFARATSPR